VWTKVKTANGQIGFVDNSLFQTEVIVIESTPPQATSQGQQVVEYAKQLLGVPYVYAGASANGVDCSGLTKYVYGRMGVYLYHGSNSQARSNYQSISFSTSNYEATLLPGDLVFFNNVYTSPNSNYTHVGIYVGNGQMIHSPQPGQTVRYESLYARNAYSPVRLVKRIF
jgi:cell wall-associated NlpC family hydrolase